MLQAGLKPGFRQSVRGLGTSHVTRDRMKQPTGRAGHVSPWQRVPFFHERAPPLGVDKSLQERLDDLYVKDVVTDQKVDIGFAPVQTNLGRKGRINEWRRKTRSNKELEKAAREGTLNVDLGVVREQWVESGQVFQDIYDAAELYGVFEDMFQHAFFKPCLTMNVNYEQKDGETLVPVHRGNIVKPSEASRAPEVNWASSPDMLWTLAMVSLDTHMTVPGGEYLHWLVTNIKGGDLASGDVMCDYLQPFPPQGTGYHRHVFVLYHQDMELDLGVERRAKGTVNLQERTFSTFDFYSKYQEQITPAGLAFFQSDYDLSLRDFFHHTLDMKEPRYEYEFPDPYIRPWNNFYVTNLRKGFDEFLNRHRDPKDIEREVLVKKLAHTCPFEGDLEVKEMKYPGLHMGELEEQIPAPIGEKRFNPKQAFKIPQWRRNAIQKERMREGYFQSTDHKDLRRDPALNS